MSRGLRLDRLVGREVYTANGRRLGRLEEFRAERRGTNWIITEYVVGTAGVLERLGLGVRLILGFSRRHGYVVGWDQLDLTDADRPRLTCSVADLRRE
jgi:sporulation protein YlmC with PRC-barrel domain